MNIELRLANYLSRYAPSHTRVLEYLAKKKVQNPEDLLLGFGYDESLMADMWMRTFIAEGKWVGDIRRKYMLKWFPKELIEEKLEQNAPDIHTWENYRWSIENQIRTYLQRKKSLRIIAMTLVRKYPYFRDEIEALIIDSDDSDGLKKEVQKYKNKYNLSGAHDRQKFYAALMRKWFSYSDIRSVLSDDIEE